MQTTAFNSFHSFSLINRLEIETKGAILQMKRALQVQSSHELWEGHPLSVIMVTG